MHKNYIKSSFYYLCIAISINVIATILRSDFIKSFPGADFLTIMLTLLAINIATSSYIVSKLQELFTNADKVAKERGLQNPVNFRKTYNSIRSSIKEQIILVIIACVLLIIRGSEYIKPNDDVEISKYFGVTIDILLTTVFILIISILWDTGQSIFMLAKDDNENIPK